jgi:hypothetical protein
MSVPIPSEPRISFHGLIICVCNRRSYRHEQCGKHVLRSCPHRDGQLRQRAVPVARR